MKFGHRVGITIGAKKLIITSDEDYIEENLHDIKTLESLIEQMENSKFKKPEELIYDRGGRNG